MKTEQVILSALIGYCALHLLLAADMVPDNLRPFAEKLENKELTKAASAVLGGLFGAI